MAPRVLGVPEDVRGTEKMKDRKYLKELYGRTLAAVRKYHRTNAWDAWLEFFELSLEYGDLSRKRR